MLVYQTVSSVVKSSISIVHWLNLQFWWLLGCASHLGPTYNWRYKPFTKWDAPLSWNTSFGGQQIHCRRFTTTSLGQLTQSHLVVRPSTTTKPQSTVRERRAQGIVSSCFQHLIVLGWWSQTPKIRSLFLCRWVFISQAYWVYFGASKLLTYDL